MFACTKNAYKIFRKEKIHEFLSAHAFLLRSGQTTQEAATSGASWVHAGRSSLKADILSASESHLTLTDDRFTFPLYFLAFYKKWLSPRQNQGAF